MVFFNVLISKPCRVFPQIYPQKLGKELVLSPERLLRCQYLLALSDFWNHSISRKALLEKRLTLKNNLCKLILFLLFLSINFC